MNKLYHNIDYQLTAELASDELLDLINAQYDDDTAWSAPGEFLGGNGTTQWGHCQGNDQSDSFDMSDDIDYKELISIDEDTGLSLAHTVHSRQGSLDANGQYNVRDLAHWTRNVYDGDKAHARALRVHKDLLGLPASLKRSDRTREGLEARKARKLARLAKRKG